MMLSLCNQYYQVVLAQGLCTGLGGGLIYVPALAIVSSQFSTKRPLAVGIASTGSNIGVQNTETSRIVVVVVVGANCFH